MDATADPSRQTRKSAIRHRRVGGAEIASAAIVAAVLLAGSLLIIRLAQPSSPWLVAGFMALALAAILVVYRVAVFGPLSSLIRHSRERLGEKVPDRDFRAPSECRDLSLLVERLFADVAASADNEGISRRLREELRRAQELNRQLMDVGHLGKEINAALPYRETVEKVLSATRTFLRADFVALLLLDEDAGSFTIESAQGTSSQTLTADCCASTPDCPVRTALAGETLVRTAGHTCSLFPRTMTHQVVIPIAVENIGRLALLVTTTGTDYVQLLPDGILTALQNHTQAALSNAYKYDAIRRQVVTDHLTHLYNRRFFANRAREEIERTLRYKSPLSILMVDIDHFKRFNDVHGHATGDRVLQAVARAMQAALRTSDVCARYGGEEFAMLLPNTTGENALYVAERVRKTLQRTRYTGLGLPADVNITISVGVATCPRDATSFEELLRLADEALYEAKSSGRDRVVLYHAAHAAPSPA